MKFVIIILTFIFINKVKAQKNRIDPIYFAVSCGFAGYTAKEIQIFKKESRFKDSASLKSKLLEGSESEQVLSAILLNIILQKVFYLFLSIKKVS